jgi:hypothetical protein
MTNHRFSLGFPDAGHIGSDRSRLLLLRPVENLLRRHRHDLSIGRTKWPPSVKRVGYVGEPIAVALADNAAFAEDGVEKIALDTGL